MDKIHANITLTRQGTGTLFQVGIPAELMEGEQEPLLKEILCRNYTIANEHVTRFIQETDIPLLVVDRVKNCKRLVRLITQPEYTPVDEVDNLKLRFHPNRMITVEKSNANARDEAVEKIFKSRDRGHLSDFQFVTKLIEVTK